MGYMKDWNEELLLLISEGTCDEKMKRYIKSILMERYNEQRNISALYRKMKQNEFTRNDIIWNRIALTIAAGNYLVIADDFNKILENMPMEYLAIIATSNADEVTRTCARNICYKKQEEYEKEIGIYDKGHELKYDLKLRRERRKIK